MTHPQRMRACFLVSLGLLGIAARAQTGMYDPTRAGTTEIPASLAPLNAEALRTAMQVNRGVQRTETVWRRVIHYPPIPTDVEKEMREKRDELGRSVLSPNDQKILLETHRQYLERTAKGHATTEEFRVQWDGVRSCYEQTPNTVERPNSVDMMDLQYYDAEKWVVVERFPRTEPYDSAIVQPLKAMANPPLDFVEGMGTLVKGAPLETALKDAYMGIPMTVGNRVELPIYRRSRPAESVFFDFGEARLTADLKTGRIVQITIRQPGGERVRTTIAPADYREFPGGLLLPGKIVVTRHGDIDQRAKEVYTLISAKSNDELAPEFLDRPLFSRPTSVADYRLSRPPQYYISDDKPHSRERLEQMQMAKATRDYVPLALLLQIPLVTAVLLRRRKQAGK